MQREHTAHGTIAVVYRNSRLDARHIRLARWNITAVTTNITVVSRNIPVIATGIMVVSPEITGAAVTAHIITVVSQNKASRRPQVRKFAILHFSRNLGFSYEGRVSPCAQPPLAQESWVCVDRQKHHGGCHRPSTDITVALVNITVPPVDITVAPKNSTVVITNITVVPRNRTVVATNITVVLKEYPSSHRGVCFLYMCVSPVEFPALSRPRPLCTRTAHARAV